MKKSNYVIAVLFVMMCFFGCAQEAKVKTGVYVLENSGMTADPSLVLDTEDNSFSFSYSMLSSYWPSGFYKIENQMLIAETYDGENTYQFKIMNDNTLVFVEEGSSFIPSIGEKQAIQEGSIFSYKK